MTLRRGTVHLAKVCYLHITGLVDELYPDVGPEGICEFLTYPTLQFFLPVMFTGRAGIVQERIVEISPSSVVRAPATQPRATRPAQTDATGEFPREAIVGGPTIRKGHGGR